VTCSRALTLRCLTLHARLYCVQLACSSCNGLAARCNTATLCPIQASRAHNPVRSGWGTSLLFVCVCVVAGTSLLAPSCQSSVSLAFNPQQLTNCGLGMQCTPSSGTATMPSTGC
jgi:hypothetical protein